MSTTINALTQSQKLTRFEKEHLVDRYARSVLNPYQYTVLTYVFDRTVRWSKDWELITIPQMLEGVWDSAGNLVSAILNISRSSAKRSIQYLVDNGFVARKSVYSKRWGTTRYYYKINWEKLMGLPNAPKKQRTERTSAMPEPRKRERPSGGGGSHRTPQRFSQNLYNKEDITPSKEGKDLSISELKLASNQDDQDTTKGTQEDNKGTQKAIEQARLKHQASLRHKIEKADKKSGNLHPEDTRAVWRASVEENWPNGYVAGWTGKQFRKAKNLARYMGKDTREFIEWSVANWHLVQKSKFPQGSLKSITFPESPNFDFFFAFRNSFVDVWKDRTFYEQIANRKNAGLIVSLRKKGYTVEQAIEAANAMTQHTQKKDELAAREVKVLQRERSVAAREYKTRIGADVVNMGSTEQLSSTKEILARNNRAIEEVARKFGRKKFTVKDSDW